MIRRMQFNSLANEPFIFMAESVTKRDRKCRTPAPRNMSVMFKNMKAGGMQFSNTRKKWGNRLQHSPLSSDRRTTCTLCLILNSPLQIFGKSACGWLKGLKNDCKAEISG